MKPTLFEVEIKAKNQGEGEDLSEKVNLQKMNVPFFTKKDIRRNTVRSCIKRNERVYLKHVWLKMISHIFHWLGVSSVTSVDEWLCDSACSFHMCFRKEWFFNFKELDGGVVHLADNQPCKVVGIGSISLKNHDGSTRVLKDVRYILKLEKNLISLGTFESKGFTIIMQNGILKVVSGALVVMKGIRRNNR